MISTLTLIVYALFIGLLLWLLSYVLLVSGAGAVPQDHLDRGGGDRRDLPDHAAARCRRRRQHRGAG